MTTLRRLFLACTAIAAAGLLTTSSTLASPNAGDDGSWLAVAGPVPLFDLSDLKPGDHGETEINVTNQMPEAARFSLKVVDLRSDDFGCNEPESDAGDTSCGQDEGELDDALELTVHPAGSDGSSSGALRTDVLSAWTDAGAEDDTVLSAGADRTYVVSYELPVDAGNAVQSDRVSFALEMSLDQATEKVGGVSFGKRPTATILATDELARTGTEVFALVRIGAGAIAVGAVLLLLFGHLKDRSARYPTKRSRRRRQHSR